MILTKFQRKLSQAHFLYFNDFEQYFHICRFNSQHIIIKGGFIFAQMMYKAMEFNEILSGKYCITMLNNLIFMKKYNNAPIYHLWKGYFLCILKLCCPFL